MTRQWKKIGRSISMLAAGITLGLLVSMAWHPPTPNSGPPSSQEPSQIWLSIERLEVEQQELKNTLANLRQELAGRQKAAAADTDRLQDLKAELDRQQLLAGLIPVQGPGVVVILDDSHAKIPAGGDPSLYLVHEYDLRDIVNLLWIAGSEAIAINDERLANNSSVYCAGSTVMVNNTRLSPPYVIRAIGNPRVQQDYLRNPSYLKNLKQKERMYGLRFEVEGVSQITVPAYNGGFLVQHARLGE